jgi:dihydroorotate dehydrogenase (fumarate)
MMDLTTTYLGLTLRTPFMPGASPITDDLGVVRELEDMGAGAIVLRSLFEEQVVKAETGYLLGGDRAYSLAEGLSFMPAPDPSALWPEEYLRLVSAVKAAVSVPVIASLNGVTRSGWIRYAAMVEHAGADALELNVYHALATPGRNGAEIEDETVGLVRDVKASVGIPVAVKLSPYWSNLADLAARLEGVGADGLVLFNRFYQPDIDAEHLQVRRTLTLSSPSELPLRLRWMALLSAQVKASLAVTGGVHHGKDAVKCVLAGAHAIQVVSALMLRGPGYMGELIAETVRWMQANDWDSLSEMRGYMNLARCPDPAAYERVNYSLILQGTRS